MVGLLYDRIWRHAFDSISRSVRQSMIIFFPATVIPVFVQKRVTEFLDAFIDQILVFCIALCELMVYNLCQVRSRAVDKPSIILSGSVQGAPATI